MKMKPYLIIAGIMLAIIIAVNLLPGPVTEYSWRDNTRFVFAAALGLLTCYRGLSWLEEIGPPRPTEDDRWDY